VGKAKQQVGNCEFMVYRGEGTGYGALMDEGEGHKCNRPATVRRDGKNLCGRHDSELSSKDIKEIEEMAERAEAVYSPFHRPVAVVAEEFAEEFNARIEAQRQQREAERALRQAEIARRLQAWREQNTRTCSQCGRPFTARFSGICWVCRAAQRDAERAARRDINFGLQYGRGMPLNVQPDPPEPPAKPLQEQFNTKRKFLKE
jgi:hypothetical protein